MPEVTSRPFRELLPFLAKIEEAISDLDGNDRINVLMYAIAGYVVSMAPPGEREQAAKKIGKEITFACLPIMAQVGKFYGTDFETLSKPMS